MQDKNEAIQRARLNQMDALSTWESISVVGGRLSVSDPAGNFYVYLGDISDVTPDDILAMQNNPSGEGGRILRNLDDLRAWRATHKLDVNGYRIQEQPAPRGRASRKARIARANAKRK